MVVGLVGASVAFASCGQEGIKLAPSNPNYAGAVLFHDHCAGCHSLAAAGAQGSATSTVGRIRNSGPDLNVRKETMKQVIFAIENGGFSGAIMPENLVVGHERQEVAQFVSKYAGQDAHPAVSAFH